MRAMLESLVKLDIVSCKSINNAGLLKFLSIISWIMTYLVLEDNVD